MRGRPSRTRIVVVAAFKRSRAQFIGNADLERATTPAPGCATARATATIAAFPRITPAPEQLADHPLAGSLHAARRREPPHGKTRKRPRNRPFQATIIRSSSETCGGARSGIGATSLGQLQSDPLAKAGLHVCIGSTSRWSRSQGHCEQLRRALHECQHLRPAARPTSGRFAASNRHRR